MNVHDIKATRIDGSEVSLSDFAGTALLIVNVASKCGFTTQYEGLQKISDEMSDVTVLGFPCNQFGGQEPGAEAEIAEFCRLTYDVDFPMFAKVDVKGPDRHPLFDALTQVADSGGNDGDIKWNFEKFVVNAAGEPVARFRTQVEPDSDEVRAALKAAGSQ